MPSAVTRVVTGSPPSRRLLDGWLRSRSSAPRSVKEPKAAQRPFTPERDPAAERIVHAEQDLVAEQPAGELGLTAARRRREVPLDGPQVVQAVGREVLDDRGEQAGVVVPHPQQAVVHVREPEAGPCADVRGRPAAVGEVEAHPSACRVGRSAFLNQPVPATVPAGVEPPAVAAPHAPGDGDRRAVDAPRLVRPPAKLTRRARGPPPDAEDPGFASLPAVAGPCTARSSPAPGPEGRGYSVDRGRTAIAGPKTPAAKRPTTSGRDSGGVQVNAPARRASGEGGVPAVGRTRAGNATGVHQRRDSGRHLMGRRARREGARYRAETRSRARCSGRGDGPGHDHRPVRRRGRDRPVHRRGRDPGRGGRTAASRSRGAGRSGSCRSTGAWLPEGSEHVTPPAAPPRATP